MNPYEPTAEERDRMRRQREAIDVAIGKEREVTTTTVKQYKGDDALNRGIAAMQRDGWKVQPPVQARKQAYSWKTGLFTKQQIYTVTFMK
jgi:hypothetical protein